MAGATALSLALTMSLPGSASDSAAKDKADSFNWEAAGTNGWSTEQNRSGSWELAQAAKLNAAISALRPQRSGVIDAYVVSIALDSDPVFGREAAEAAKVLSRRYDADGRTILLSAGSTVKAEDPVQGSPAHLSTALAAVAGKMDKDEDILVLFATAHGHDKGGLVYSDREDGFGLIGPKRLATILSDLGLKRRLVILSACFSGIFIPALNDPENITITAASAKKTSFGCQPSNDWTFFGDALINNALRQPQPLSQATDQAFALIKTWESTHKLTPSDPQFRKGRKADVWLTQIEARIPKDATAKVGRPSISTLD